MPIWSADTFVDEPDPREISCDEFIALLFEDHEDLIGPPKMEFYAGKVRIGGFPFYDFVKGYLRLRGETVCPLDEDAG